MFYNGCSNDDVAFALSSRSMLVTCSDTLAMSPLSSFLSATTSSLVAIVVLTSEMSSARAANFALADAEVLDINFASDVSVVGAVRRFFGAICGQYNTRAFLDRRAHRN